MADYLEAYAARFELPVRTGVRVDRVSTRRRPLPGGRRPTGAFDGRARRRGDGELPAPQAAGVRARARPGHRPAPLARLPQPGPAPGGRRADRRRGQLGGGDRAGDGAGAATRPGCRAGTPATCRSGSTGPPRRLGLAAVRAPGAVPPRADAGHADRPEGAAGDAGEGRAADPGQAARTWRRAASSACRGWRACRDGMPLLEDGRVLDVANVIWCTGFQPGFSWIDLPVFDERRRAGAPAGDRAGASRGSTSSACISCTRCRRR